jgi:hypothetical protein
MSTVVNMIEANPIRLSTTVIRITQVSMDNKPSRFHPHSAWTIVFEAAAPILYNARFVH